MTDPTVQTPLGGGLAPARIDQAYSPGPVRVIAPGGAAGALRAFLVIVGGSGALTGVFVYNGPPASGNLIASIAAVAGTDPFGNAYQNGIVAYNTVSGTFVQMTSASQTFDVPANTAQAMLSLATVISGIDTLQLTSPGVSAGSQQALLGMVSGPAGGTPALVRIANAVLNMASNQSPVVPANGYDLYANNTRPAIISQTGLDQRVSASNLADFTNITVTAAALTDITKAWSVPANDMEAGATYELIVSGSGTTPTVATTLQFGGILASTFGATGTFGSTMFPAAADAFRFKVRYTIYCLTTGAGGTYDNDADITVSIFGTSWLPANTANFTAHGTGSNTTALSVNTTIANTIRVQAAWGAAGNGATLTARRSSFRRIA